MMRSLVWTFWIAMLLAALGTFAVSILIMSQWHRFATFSEVQGRPHGMLLSLAGEIETVIDNERLLAELLKNNVMSQFGEVYLIEPSGRDVLDRPIPHEILTSAPLEPSIDSPDPALESMSSPPILARAIRTNSGAMYFMIFRFNAPTHPVWILFQRFGLTWVLVAAIAVSGILSAWLASIVVRPIKSLVAASQRQGDGQLDTYIDEKLLARQDELGELARQLKISATKIQELMRQQQDFLRDVSHEVRTPLARLQIAAESVEIDAGDKGSVMHIQREVQVIDRLVQDLLHLSHTDQPRSAQHTEGLAIGSIMDQCVENAQLLGKPDSISIMSELEHPNTSVLGLPVLLERAIDNVLTNAIRHSPPNSEITVHGFVSEAGYVVEISDNGPGVPTKDLEAIFQPFVRLDDARQRRTGGTGLGLSLVRRIIELHEGTVSAENIDTGGLRITLVLPMEERACAISV